MRLRHTALAVALAAAVAGAVTYAPVPQLLVVGVAALVLLALLVFASPVFAAVLLGVSIPELQDVTGGHLGVHVAGSDVLLVLIAVRLLTDAAVTQRLPVLRAIRPVALPLVQYAWFIAVLLLLHLGLGSAYKSAQRVELFALPVIVGAYVALRGQHMIVLRCYVLAATVLAVAWPVLNPTGVLGSQFDKNPVGGLIAGAILLLLAVRGLRRLLWCMPVLLVGLGFTASRGAVLAVVVGIVVISLAYGAGSRRVLIARTLALLAVGAMAYPFLPSDITSRLTNFSSGFTSRSSIALYIRQIYDHDAEQIIAAHPLTGVGVGNYLAGNPANLTQTNDPHNVILLEAAEGGYLFAASFVVLILGTAFVLWRLRRVELAAAAVGVLLATVAHGIFDVYWVRGTPILGFLLVGMVCGLAARHTIGPPTLGAPT